MCGIAGVIDIKEQRQIDENILLDMNQAQFHRGPDEGGMHREPGAGLVHRRLSIIDLSTGQQPLYNEDRTVLVVYNGEIFNFHELTAELVKFGHHFRTHSDTEVIVHAWEQWGEDCVKRFRGMFAFAIWDQNKQCVFLARDRLGIKPLYYSFLPSGFLIFASELKAILKYPLIRKQVDPCAVEDFMTFGYIPEPKSIFAGILKLHPGHTLLQKRAATPARSRQYWNVSFAKRPVQEGVELELVERLREAVRIRLVAEVPLGAFLSGGVDSSAIVALMAQLSNAPVNTCSISFGDPKFNEAEYAQKVAERYQTRHRVEQVNTEDFDLIDRLALLYDEPFADSSAIPTFRVCELARKSVTVALSGDGGDENFAGYRRYQFHMAEEKLRAIMPHSMRGPLFGLLGYLYPKMDWAPQFLRAKTTFQSLARDSVAAYLHSVSTLPYTLRAQLYSKSLRSSLQSYQAVEVFRHYAKDAPVEDALSLVQYLDFKTYLPGDILTKVDRASMANSLEVRVPILDHLFVEWVAGLDSNLKLAKGQAKHIFKKAMEPYLDKEILYRKKMGFAVPIANWFRGPLRQRVQDALLGGSLLDSGYFDGKTIRTLIEQHQSGRRDNSVSLWSLLMFESFQRQVMRA